jgi:hypothetical protein
MYRGTRQKLGSGPADLRETPRDSISSACDREERRVHAAHPPPADRSALHTRLLSDALGLMLRRPFFFSTLLGQMMSDNATADGAGDGVMPRVVARNAAHDGTLQTAGRVRGSD